MKDHLTIYKVVREEDESGMSGTGVVAYVVDWPHPCEFVTMGWVTTPHQSVATYNSMEAVEQLHGHGGKTHFIQTYTVDCGND